MRKYGITGLLFLAALGLQSCLFSEEDLFEDTSANRTAASVAKYTELLTGAENGWKLDYYPGGETHDMGGTVLLMQFEGENVTMMSDQTVQGFNDRTETPAGTRVASTYSINADQGPVLSFDTYNVLLHYYCEPRGGLDVDGFEGDYEFVITAATQDDITLRGKKYGTVMHLTRLPADTDWDSYIAGCVQVYDESGEYGTLVGYNGTQTFAPSVFSQQNVITFTETDSEGERTQQRVSFIYTDRGIRFFEPTVVNGVTCDEFTWDNATKTFTSTADANVRLKYERPADYLPIEFYTEHEWEASYDCDFGMNDTTEAVTFTRVEDTDTLLTHFTALNMSYEVKAIYNPTTGMIEFRTQFLDRVTLITTDNKQVNAYFHLCPWNEFDGTVYLANNAGIVSYTSQMEPRVLEFADNGRMSGSDFNGFVFLAFDGPERTSNQLGALGTFSEIKLRQIVEEDTEE